MALHLLSNYYYYPYNNNYVNNNNGNNSSSCSGSFTKFYLRFPSSGTPHSAGLCFRQSGRPSFIISRGSSSCHSQTRSKLLSSSSSSLYSSHCNPLNSTVSKKFFPRNRNSTRGRFVPRSHMTTEPEPPVQEGRMLVFVPPHSLIKHWVSVLRNEQTPCPIFKNAMAELGRLLMYEASRDWLPTVTGEIQSPMGVAAVEFIDPREPVAVVPILRAGLALAEHAASVLPAAKTYHLGVSRNEETLLPTVYLNKLPERFPEGSRVFVVDPMLATDSCCGCSSRSSEAQ